LKIYETINFPRNICKTERFKYKLDIALRINFKSCVSGYPTQRIETDDILEKPLLVITNVNSEENDLNEYYAEGGLSALANESEAKQM
jgi:hypothetical protein